MADCMRYAAEHSYAVRKQMYETNSYKAERDRAIASFFPSLSAGIGGTMNWGRSIDPNTNTYTTQQSFANNYDLSASMPLFAGGQYVKQWMLDIARLKDEAAMNAMQAFVDVVYYRETVRLSEQNLEDSRRNLYKTEQEEALGLKGKADVAQFRSQVATADYQLTSQQNLYNTSLLTLKQVMNFPFLWTNLWFWTAFSLIWTWHRFWITLICCSRQRGKPIRRLCRPATSSGRRS